MAAIQLNPREKILKQSRTSVREPGRTYFYGGTVFLTNERFIMYKRSFLWQFFFGILSLLWAGTYQFDIPLTSVQSISRIRSRSYIQLETISGEKYDFIFRFNVWLPILRDALLTYHQLEMVDTGNDTWVVQAPSV